MGEGMMDQEAPKNGVSIDEDSKQLESGGDAVPDSDTSSPSSSQREKQSGYGNSEHNFDKGLKAWLQVLGAFFLWFNSW